MVGCNCGTALKYLLKSDEATFCLYEVFSDWNLTCSPSSPCHWAFCRARFSGFSTTSLWLVSFFSASTKGKRGFLVKSKFLFSYCLTFVLVAALRIICRFITDVTTSWAFSLFSSPEYVTMTRYCKEKVEFDYTHQPLQLQRCPGTRGIACLFWKQRANFETFWYRKTILPARKMYK